MFSLMLGRGRPCASSSLQRGDPHRYRPVFVALVLADIAFAFQQTAIIPALSVAGRSVPSELAFTVAFGTAAALCLIGSGLALAIPGSPPSAG